jgi:diguanylate cyclase (GGDEF)-like protein
LHHVDPVFPVTLAPGESVRILLRAQDSSVPTTFVTAWTPNAYTQALTWTLVHETITLTVCGVLIALLLWTREPAGRLLAGLMAAAECLSATFHGQWVPYFLPGAVGHLVPVFTIAVALCYLMFTLSARSLLDIGRRGFWAWVLGGINAVSLLTALGTLFVDEAMLLRKWVNALGELVFLVWPLAAWRTPLPDRPGARAIQMAFVLSGAMMGLAVWVSRYGRPVHFAELIVVCVLLVYSHVHLSSQKARRKQTEYLAFHDPLTGLPNRVRGEHLLHQALDAARSRGGTAGLLCMDLDKFKLVNDTHGHATGDLLLQGVANRLRHSLGAQDSACRLSGDEFIAILPEVHGILALEQRCEAIRAQFTRPFDLDGKRLFISFSIGASLYPAHADTADALMRHADTALYEAKRAGENGFRVFHPDMNTRMLARVSTRNALHLALEREEFELHYQPQVGLRSGAVVGVEALLRWGRPGHGLSQPQDFIAVAEEVGWSRTLWRPCQTTHCRRTVWSWS